MKRSSDEQKETNNKMTKGAKNKSKERKGQEVNDRKIERNPKQKKSKTKERSKYSVDILLDSFFWHALREDRSFLKHSSHTYLSS